MYTIALVLHFISNEHGIYILSAGVHSSAKIKLRNRSQFRLFRYSTCYQTEIIIVIVALTH